MLKLMGKEKLGLFHLLEMLEKQLQHDLLLNLAHQNQVLNCSNQIKWMKLFDLFERFYLLHVKKKKKKIKFLILFCCHIVFS